MWASRGGKKRIHKSCGVEQKMLCLCMCITADVCKSQVRVRDWRHWVVIKIRKRKMWERPGFGAFRGDRGCEVMDEIVSLF